jgi:hypothetical protein
MGMNHLNDPGTAAGKELLADFINADDAAQLFDHRFGCFKGVNIKGEDDFIRGSGHRFTFS